MNDVMKEIILERTGRRPLTFRGREVWRWETSPDRAHPRYSGDPGRWTALVLYLVADLSQYVLYEQRLSNWTGERDHLEAHTFDTLPEIADWLEQHCPGAVSSFCDKFQFFEELSDRLPADVSVVTTEQVGAVTVRVVTDGVQHAWELRGPDGSVLVESQPAPITAEQAEREAFVAASAAALRFGALGEEARHA